MAIQSRGDSKMIRRPSWVLPLRFVQIIFGLAVAGLTAYVIASLFDKWAFSSCVDYLLFLGLWTGCIAVPYLGAAPILLTHFAHYYIIPGVEIVTMLMWLAGFIAMAVLLPSPDKCTSSTCQALQATTVIGGVEWAIFVATGYTAIIEVAHRRQVERRAEQEQEQPEQTDAHETQETQQTQETAQASV